MAFSSLLDTVNCLTMEKTLLTNELTDIMTTITQASGKTTKLLRETNDKKSEVKETYDAGTDQYEAAMDDINDDYELSLAEITDWESDLEQKKEAKETEVQAVTSYVESYKSALKQNIQTDMKYAQSGS